MAEVTNEEVTNDYEKPHSKHNWWNWYAPYLGARCSVKVIGSGEDLGAGSGYA